MPLSFPSSPTSGQLYQSGSSATYEWNGSYWKIKALPRETALNVEQSNIATSASYAETASYAPTIPGRYNKNITSISQTGYGFVLMVVEGRLYAMKSSDTGTYAAQPAALLPNSYTTYLQRGVENAYEIVFPSESGSAFVTSSNTYGNTAYALFSNGNLYTWGNNSYGQCGYSGTEYYPRLAATQVAEVYTHRSQGQSEPDYTRLLIRKTDGKIYGTGYNGERQLGLADATNRSAFTELPWCGTNPLSVWNLGAYRGNTFVQKSDGTIWVAGYNGNGEIGDNSTTQPNAAKEVSAWLNSNTANRIVEMFAGHRACDNSACNEAYNNSMLLSDGTTTTLLSAGYNGYGSHGDGSTAQRTTPVKPAGVTGAWETIARVASTGGAYRSMYVLKQDGTLWTWGMNDYAQLGQGDTTQRNSPTQVTITAAMGTVQDIIPTAQGYFRYSWVAQSPLIKTSTGYWMCGYNGIGTTGTGKADSNVTRFTRVKLPRGVEIKLFGQTTTTNEGVSYYAIDTLNRIWAWGYNAHYMIDPLGTTNVFQPICITPTVLRN